ncbi:NAD-dependent epimerase/dehydratase family protein [Streptococcus uberis]|uniref:NAD-dependent epimerase/dehydratase family protein n=1 Tax=Streptococcus uberis TaxID=1349 RepID=UPI0012B5BF73|nr:NAD(P)-dependent oxidoreductase [Streptococcus uberis]MTB42344.1 NAD-dependent epimerase/dehydratase family protein [Streptococcus uberis]MTB98856.1 NAD-dependent epimerase/dehydratase family protein [Streptococcus uberis]
MKILVTGANGYLGKGVVKELLDKGYQVIATDFKSNYIDSRATIFEEDLFKIDNPFEHFGKPDILIHMAWRDGFVHNSINHINDLPLHYNFIENMIKSGLKHVTVLGSMHEVGFYEGAITENTPTHPQSLYGISKDALRNAIELLCKQNSVIFQWLRGFYIVGNTKDGSSIFSKIIQANLEGKTEFPFTLGLNQFDFLNYDEFCEAVALTSVQSKINGIINICSGRPEKLADRVERFIKENNLNIKLIYGAFPDRPYDSKAVWGSDLKLNKIMKLQNKKEMK